MDKQEHLKHQEVHIQTGESLLDPNDVCFDLISCKLFDLFQS